MPSSSPLENLFRTKLLPAFQTLRNARRVIYLYRFLMVVIPLGEVVSVVVFLYYYGTTLMKILISRGLDSNYVPLILITLVALVMGVTVLNLTRISLWYQERYRQAFKEFIVREIVKFIDPSWSYTPNASIPKSLYKASGLFLTEEDSYKGDDLVGGIISKTDFQFSEVQTQYRHWRRTPKGLAYEESDIFHGFFFHADFNKYIHGKTYVVSSEAPARSHPPPVQLENPVFNAQFATFSDDQIEARYILTPKIMEQILHLKECMGVPLSFSFLGNRLYLAAHFGRNLLELSLGEELRFDRIKQYHDLIQLAVVIVSEMDLNNRIWTKE